MEDFMELISTVHPMGEIKLKLGNHESNNFNFSSTDLFSF